LTPIFGSELISKFGASSVLGLGHSRETNRDDDQAQSFPGSARLLVKLPAILVVFFPKKVFEDTLQVH
jgi:hypothetical protein